MVRTRPAEGWTGAKISGLCLVAGAMGTLMRIFGLYNTDHYVRIVGSKAQPALPALSEVEGSEVFPPSTSGLPGIISQTLY